MASIENPAGTLLIEERRFIDARTKHEWSYAKGARSDVFQQKLIYHCFLYSPNFPGALDLQIYDFNLGGKLPSIVIVPLNLY